jgi:hypothetical protein
MDALSSGLADARGSLKNCKSEASQESRWVDARPRYWAASFASRADFRLRPPGSTNNGLTFGSTFVNRVPGVSPFLVNPNSHLYPNTAVVLNPAA